MAKLEPKPSHCSYLHGSQMCHASCSLNGKRQEISGAEFIRGNFVQILIIFVFHSTTMTEIALKVAIRAEFHYYHQWLCWVKLKHHPQLTAVAKKGFKVLNTRVNKQQQRCK